MPRPAPSLLALLLAATASATGCVQTAMLPAHQLDAGETAVAAQIDEPGALYIPRASVQVTRGLGGGDLTTNLGGTVGTLGGGLSGRYYLTETLNAEVQVQGTYLLDDWGGTALVGVQQTASGASSWYLGAQGGVLHGEELTFNRSDAQYSRQTLPVVGGTIGLGRIHIGEHWRMQIELEANATIPYSETAGLPPSRLSIGVFRLWE